MATLNIRQLRIALWSLAGAFGGAAILAIALAAGLPLDAPADPSSSGSSRVTRANSPAAAKDAGGDVWSIDLRRPLVDAPAAPPPEAASTFVPPSMPTLRVLGTVVEAGHSVALVDIGGKTQFKSVGQVVNGLRIDAVDENECVVEFNGRPVAVAIERPSPGSADAPPIAARPVSPYGDRQ